MFKKKLLSFVLCILLISQQTDAVSNQIYSILSGFAVTTLSGYMGYKTYKKKCTEFSQGKIQNKRKELRHLIMLSMLKGVAAGLITYGILEKFGINQQSTDVEPEVVSLKSTDVEPEAVSPIKILTVAIIPQEYSVGATT